MVLCSLLIPIVFDLDGICLFRNPLPATHMYIICNQPTSYIWGVYHAYHVDLSSDTQRGRSNLYTDKYYGL